MFSTKHYVTRIGYIAALVLALMSTTGVLFAQDDTITITHNQGETVVPVNPETVITFDLASLSTLDALGIEVVGVPDTYFPESMSKYAGEEYTKVGSLFEPDYELINSMEPDLIIVAARSAAVYPELSELAPTIDLTADNTLYLESQLANAKILGQIFDKEAEVEALWVNIEASVAAVSEVAPEVGPVLTAMVTGGEVNAFGPDSRFGWLYSELGFVPVIDDIEAATHGESISFEFILETNPDWLIVIDRDTAIGQESESAAQVLDNELVAQTTAWQENQVIYLNPNNWYLVMGGLGAIQEMVDDIALELDIELEVAAEVTPEATAEAGE